MKNRILLASLIIFPNLGFAFFCPTNFNQIDFGMKPDQIIQACGKPDDQKELIKENDNVPQEWNYYIPRELIKEELL